MVWGSLLSAAASFSFFAWSWTLEGLRTGFWYYICACHTAHTQWPPLTCLSQPEALSFCIRMPNIESVDVRSHVGAMSHMPTSGFHSASSSFDEIQTMSLCCPFFVFFTVSLPDIFFGISFSSFLFRISRLSVFPSWIVSCTNLVSGLF